MTRLKLVCVGFRPLVQETANSDLRRTWMITRLTPILEKIQREVSQQHGIGMDAAAGTLTLEDIGYIEIDLHRGVVRADGYVIPPSFHDDDEELGSMLPIHVPFVSCLVGDVNEDWVRALISELVNTSVRR